jgi:hypothetical protein
MVRQDHELEPGAGRRGRDLIDGAGTVGRD